MNKELDDLIAKKKEIEKQIKALQSCEHVFGKAKYSIEHYPTDKPDRHYIAINVNRYLSYDYLLRNKDIWRTIINGKNIKEVVEQIPLIIVDLQTLYDNLTEEK